MSKPQTLFLEDVNPNGNLSDLVSVLENGSFFEAAELLNLRRAESKTRKKPYKTCYFTKNVGAYEHNEDDTISYYVTDKVGFDKLVMPVLSDFCKKLVRRRNHFLSPSDVNVLHALVEEGHAAKLIIDPSKFEVFCDMEEGREILSINACEYKTQLTQEERAFAEILYGKGDDFDANMKLIHEQGMMYPNISALSHEYVLRRVPKGSVIIRACTVWDDDAFFNPDIDCGYGLGFTRGAVYGIPKH